MDEPVEKAAFICVKTHWMGPTPRWYWESTPLARVWKAKFFTRL
jgi:hypothetical protein